MFWFFNTRPARAPPLFRPHEDHQPGSTSTIARMHPEISQVLMRAIRPPL